MTGPYPKLTFSTGVEIDGLDMAERVSRAAIDMGAVKTTLELIGEDRMAMEADALVARLFALLGSMRIMAEREAGA
ncbi:MAG: hypothetical protein IKP53_08470 [Candidatus Methanomethylophilaceae archaeon]|nr:hypothetical protein [Candidatus Methanomethylophilaceae archaeon]